MTSCDVLEVIERPSGKVDFVLAHGKEGRERVRVVLTLHNTFACMTHRTADSCEHARIAREHYEVSKCLS